MTFVRVLLMMTLVSVLGPLAGCDDRDQAEGGAEQTEEPRAAQTGDDTDPGGAPAVSVHFESPAEGARVTSPFEVDMAAEGVGVVPAGTMEEGTGHMHILINEPFVTAGDVIPNDDTHRHYGDGSTKTKLDLEPGSYVLRLQFADGAHRAFEGDEYRDTIRVEVEAGGETGNETGEASDNGEGDG